MSISFWDGVKLTVKAVKFKYNQYLLSTNINAVVETAKGAVRGRKHLTIWGDEYFSFEKIPFAKPPIGDLRFKAPVPAEPWSTILDCTAPANIPLQGNALYPKYRGSEDCLYLNVFTKNLTPEKPCPVMVWIYGGGFTAGEATRSMYSPDYFMSKDVVVVTIAYRVGAFGFLSFDDPAVNVPGNAGLKDQILSLKWVQENIAAFGGDPNNVTLFGESAGGASVHLCMLSEQSKGLIHKGIIMSGSALCPWGRAPKTDQWAYRLAMAMGYSGENDDSKVFAFFQNANGSKIVETITKLVNGEKDFNILKFPFTPVVEPYITEDCFLAEDPQIAMKKTWSNQIPLLIGATSFEGLLVYPDVVRNPDLLNQAKMWLPLDLNLDKDSEKATECLSKLKDLYFGKEECNIQNKMRFLELISDRQFVHPMYRSILPRQNNATAPTYLYRFDFDSIDGNFMRNMFCGKGVRGVCHGDDIGYVWYGIFGNRDAENTPEICVTRTMIDIWTSFAHSSDPNCDMLKGVKFEPLTKDEKLKCLNITENTKFIEWPELEKMKVWNSFYENEKL